jgi:hypothetical protein
MLLCLLQDERSQLFKAVDTMEAETELRFQLAMAICDRKGLFEAAVSVFLCVFTTLKNKQLFQDVVLQPLRELQVFREEIYSKSRTECHQDQHGWQLEQLWRSFKKEQFVLPSKAWQDVR